MNLAFKVMLVTAFIWQAPFMVGLLWRSRWGYKSFCAGMGVLALWLCCWLSYLGWWISQHLCY